MFDGGFSNDVEVRVGGWKVGSNSVINSYGRGHRLDVLAEWIGKVAYDGVEID
jgi:hypothetical protein